MLNYLSQLIINCSGYKPSTLPDVQTTASKHARQPAVYC